MTSKHDTGELEAVADEAASKAIARVATPIPTGMTREEAMALVTKQTGAVLEAWEPGHMRRCERDGPLKRLQETLDALRRDLVESAKELKANTIGKLESKIEALEKENVTRDAKHAFELGKESGAIDAQNRRYTRIMMLVAIGTVLAQAITPIQLLLK